MRRIPFLLLFLACAASARAMEYWLRESDAKGSCSLDGNGTPAGWALSSGGAQVATAATDPDGVYHIDGLDFVYNNDTETTRGVLRGELTNLKTDYAFQGGRLVFDGCRPAVQTRLDKGKRFTVGDLLVVSGSHGEFRPGVANVTKLDGTNWTVEAGATLGLNAGDSGTRGYDCYATVRGEGVFAASAGICEDRGFSVKGTVSSGTIALYGDLSGFTGVLNAGLPGNTWDKNAAGGNAIENLKLVVADAFALPVSTPDGRLLRGAVAVTNGATISFTCDATSPPVRGWDFGSGAPPTVDVATGKTVTIQGPVDGAAGFRKTGAGTLVLDVDGAGEYGTLSFAGETNVSASVLADYYAPWNARIALGEAECTSASETAAAFSVEVVSTGSGAEPASLSALVLEAGAADPWDDASAELRADLAAPDAAGAWRCSVTGLAPATDYQVRFVLSGATAGGVRASTNAPTAFRTAAASPVPSATLAVASVWAAAADFAICVQRFGWGATGVPSLALRYGTDPEDESGWLSATVRRVPAAEGAPFSFRLSGLSSGTSYHAKLVVSNNLAATFETASVAFGTPMPGAPAGTAALLKRESASFAVQATATDFGTDALSVRVRLEASEAGSPGTVAAVSDEVFAGLGVPVALSVTGLHPGSSYRLRVRFVNDGGAETFVDLGEETTPSVVYVDSLAAPGGDGRSPATAFRTLREGIAHADAHATVRVRGGPGRAYDVTNAAEALSIPASLEGLAIRSFGGEGPAKLAVAADYTRDWRNAGNSGNVNVISNAAAHVTIEGFRFEWGSHSLGRDKCGGSSLVWTDAPFLALSGCEFVQTAGSSFAASGTTPVIWCYQANATNLLVEGCRFFNCRMTDGNLGRDYYLITPRGRGSVVGCLFTNCAAVVDVPNSWNNPVYGCSKLTFVSNTVFAARTAAASGILRASYTGPDTGEIAYNRFVNVAGSPPGAVLEKSREGWNGAGGVSIHHNTVVGYRTLICANKLDINASTMAASIFDNILLLSSGSTNIVENSDGKINGNRPTMFKNGSLYRNNALRAGAFNGGTAATQQIEDWTYDITAGLDISNVFAFDAVTAQAVTNVFASAGKPVPEDAVFAMNTPEFVNLTDPFHPDFARPRSRRGPGDVGHLGWRGANGEWPLWIGALPPLYPEATLLILR